MIQNFVDKLQKRRYFLKPILFVSRKRETMSYKSYINLVKYVNLKSIFKTNSSGSENVSLT